MGKSNTRYCYLCNTHEETIKHLYWDCQANKRLWERLKLTLHIAGIKTPNSPTFYLLGLTKNAEPIQLLAHLLCTITKKYIQTCKCLEVRGTEKGLTDRFREIELIESYISKNKGKTQYRNHQQKWNGIYQAKN